MEKAGSVKSVCQVALMILRRCWEREFDIVAMSQTGDFLVTEGKAGNVENDRRRRRNSRHINVAMASSRRFLYGHRRASLIVN
jgi:hypothetical protein